MRPVNASINGVSLRDLDGRILVRTVSEQTPQATLTYGDNPGRHGQRLLSRVRETRRVTVTFAVRELRDLSARAAVVDAVNAWAQDGYLETSYRPGKRLRVLVAARAAVQDPRNYNEEFSIQLDAPDPFWEDRDAQPLALSGTSGSGKLHNLGSAPARPVITVIPTGSTLNTLTLTVNGESMRFTGLAVPATTALVMDYDAEGYLRIRAGSANKYGCRTADSADELTAAAGASAVSFTANVSCNVKLEVRAKWL
jgi:hypothetical protein